MRKARSKQRLYRITFTTLYFLTVLLTGLVASGTYSYFTDMASSQWGEAASADSGDILQVDGSFDEEGWSGSGKSGFKIKNLTACEIWVYFEVTGTLRDVVRHIAPVGLEPGQTYEIPLDIAAAGDMGMLQWQNGDMSFSGVITARILNNYSSYQIGNVDISSAKLYEKLCGLSSEQCEELHMIKGVRDIVSLINEKNRLTVRVAQLIEENLLLNERNILLREEISSLSRTLAETSKPDAVPQVDGDSAGAAVTGTAEGSVDPSSAGGEAEEEGSDKEAVADDTAVSSDGSNGAVDEARIEMNN